MANFVFTEAKRGILAGEIDMNADDIRMLLVVSGNTLSTQEDVTTISAFTTLNEYAGTNYARQALASETVTADNANDRAEFSATNVTFTSLGANTTNAGANCTAALLYKHVTNDTDSIPIAYIDTGGFPFQGNGGDVTFQWNAEGIIQLT